jgi:predicted membrane chloride channel (bestrophin family)
MTLPAFEFEFASATQAVILWCGLALLAILILLRQPKTLLLARTAQGRLRISRHALHRLLETCCEQVGGVASARAFVQRRRGKFCTKLRLKVRPNAKLDAIQGYLTQEIVSTYRDNLGIKEVGPVEIEVVGVIAASKAFSND